MHTTAILLLNLGSPDAPTAAALKPYLTEFLMDKRVIDKPYLLRALLVKGIIVPSRAPKSAEKYLSIWTKEGSPLITHSVKLQQLVQNKVTWPVYLSMRYGKPATVDVLQKMHADNPALKEIIVFPLYPHYAMSSFETAVVQVKELHQHKGYKSRLLTVPPFYNHPTYINALANTIKPYLQQNPGAHFLFSYHGIPERHVKKTDCTGNTCLKVPNCCTLPQSPAHAYCYRHQVMETTRLVVEQLQIPAANHSVSFQSRLGRDPWLAPPTDDVLTRLPAKGIKNLLVVCPAFVSDCLETLEEIEVEGKEIFLHHGGEQYAMIPALNENEAWVDCVVELAETVINESGVSVGFEVLKG